MTTSREEDIKSIRDDLRRRSGKTWLVTGHRGTSWGWLTITAPPARRVQPLPNPHWHMPHDCRQDHRGACSDIVSHLDGPTNRTASISSAERVELAALLDIPVHLVGLGGVLINPQDRGDYVRRARNSST